MAEFSSEILYAVLALAGTWLALCWWKSNRHLPPGPWGLPLLGYLPFIKTPHVDYSRLAARHGDVFSFRTVGGRLFVILNGAKVIKEVLVNRADEFIGRLPVNNLIEWESDGLGITQEEGEVWSEHRRFFLHTAKNFGFGKLELEDRIHEEVRQMLTEMRTESKDKCIRLSDYVSYVTSSIISHVIFNRKFKKDDTFRKNVSNMAKFIEAFVGYRNILVGKPFEIFFAVFTSVKKGRDGIRQFTDAVVADVMRTRDPANAEGYVDCFLNRRDELIRKGHKDGGTFTIKRLEALSMNLFIEGTESTSSTIVAMLLELSRHPSVQRRIQAELDAVVGRQRLPSWVDRNSLPFLEATIQELYRVASQFPTTTIYSNFKETTIQGFRIPKRTAIVANLGSIHQDPKIFPQPEKFDPNRFLNSAGKKIKREGPFPFGLGKRSCIGESLAHMEVYIIICSIVQSFTMQPGDKEGTVLLIPRE